MAHDLKNDSTDIEKLKVRLKALGGYFHEREFLQGQEGVLIPKGSLIQVVGAGKTECLVEFLSLHPTLRVAWVEDEISIYPVALFQRGIGLERIFFVETGEDFVWATLQVLGSSLFDVVILTLQEQSMKTLNLKSIRRLQLATEKAKCTLFFLNDQPLSAWPISTRLEVYPTAEQKYRWRRSKHLSEAHARQ